MTVRRLGPGDLDVFRALRLEALRLEPQSFASRHDDWAALSDDEWLARLTRCAVFASFDGEAAVGLAGVLPAEDRSGEVVMVYLRRTHRGAGRAAALFAACEASAREVGMTCLNLRVARGNAPAQAAYRKAGFTVCEGPDEATSLSMSKLLA